MNSTNEAEATRQYNTTCVRYRTLKKENAASPFSDDKILWGIMEAGAVLSIEKLAERGPGKYTKTLIREAAKVTGNQREALLVCAAGRRDRVVEVMYDQFGIGPAENDRRERLFQEIKRLREEGLPDATINASAEIIGAVKIGRLLAGEKFAVGCVEMAMKETDTQIKEALLQLAAGGGRRVSRGVGPFGRDVESAVKLVGTDIVREALASTESVHKVLANKAVAFDTNGDQAKADALFTLSVAHAGALRAAVNPPKHHQGNGKKSKAIKGGGVPVPRTFGEELNRALREAGK